MNHVLLAHQTSLAIRSIVPGQSGGDPVPDADNPQLPGELGDRAADLVNAATGIGFFAGLLALIAAGILIMVRFGQGHMGAGGDGVGNVAKVLVGLAVVSAAPSIIRFFI